MKKLLILSLAILCFYACKTTYSDSLATKAVTGSLYHLAAGTSGLYGFFMHQLCLNNFEMIADGSQIEHYNERYDELHALYTDEISTNKKIVISDDENDDSDDIWKDILKSNFGGNTISNETNNQKVNTTHQKIFVSPEDSNVLIFEEYPGKDDLKTSMQTVKDDQIQPLNRVVANKKTDIVEINWGVGGKQTISKDKACRIYEKVLKTTHGNTSEHYYEKGQTLEIELTQKSGITQREETRKVDVPVAHRLFTEGNQSQEIWHGYLGASVRVQSFGYFEFIPFKSIITTTGCKTYKDTITISSGGNSSDIKKEVPCKETEKVSKIHTLKSIFVLHNDPESGGSFIWHY